MKLIYHLLSENVKFAIEPGFECGRCFECKSGKC